jgi:dethiobiotin synthetase
MTDGIVLYMAIYMTHYKYMKEANIVEFKNHLSEMIAQVENGEEIEIRKIKLDSESGKRRYCF